MSEPSARTSPTANDYGSWYYSHYQGEEYDPSLPQWQQFFGGVADRIVTTFRPRTVLDAGCAMGMLVGALRERGVDATGVDLSEYAVSKADPRAAGHLRVGDLTQPLDARYDLITCIEVLEHIEAGQVEKVIANLTGATDRLLISTTPDDFKEGTHVNVRPPAYWATLFADHGFHRRFDVDASFITPWAMALQRRDASVREVVSDYETMLWDLRRENAMTRDALIDRDRRLGEGNREDLVRELEQLRATVTTDRARAEKAEQELAVAQREAAGATKRLQLIERSTSYRLGRRIVGLVPRGRKASS
ncbi:MAG TPA: class I SAM-dependent methyltransferase [Kineosporiaceae bacterium]|nr:class I SAM-dependent methyltransferase [Kineosporiaceae bacterium]